MGSIRSIAILLHERHTFAPAMRYQIWTMAEVWREMGIGVEMVFGAGREVTADVLFPHLDMSYIPEEYWDLMQRHPRVVNRRVRDIRKTLVSTNLVRGADEYEGPVIVKTACNCGGNLDEWLLGRGRPASLGARVWNRVSRWGWIERRLLGRARTLAKYHVFDSARDVPAGAYRNPGVVVEKFLPERLDGRYVLRNWYFLGDRSWGRMCASREWVVKAINSERVAYVDPPPEVAAARARMGLDFAKIDYVMHEGRGVVLDVNVTPTFARPPDAERTALVKSVAEGILRCGAGTEPIAAE
ncbi:hypothetical protein PHYC_02648 [Phycisphaerales bacterium]|nr:hypothetical protein PHYC_02648 [Phycisphaerales bacterium]